MANAAGSAWTNNLNIGFQGIVYNGGNNVAGIIQNNIVKNINLRFCFQNDEEIYIIIN